jgi:hypothetical protein
MAPKFARRFAGTGRASLAAARARRRIVTMPAHRLQGIRMTRINGPTSYPAPPALDSAAAVAPAARPARASRSRDGSPLSSPGAPDILTAKTSAHAGTPPRTASARLFAGRGAPDDAADPPGHAAADAPAAHAGAGPGPDPQPDVGAALFITVSQLCRAGDGKLDPVFTFRLPGSPSSPQALLFKVAAQSRRAAGKATLLQDLIATAGVTGTPVVLYCDADADAGRGTGPLDALFAAPATRATTMLWAHCGGVGRAVHEPAGHAGCLRAILSDTRMGHVNIDLSWPRMAHRILAADDAARAWVRLIDDHPGRILFGTEALNARARAAAWKAIGALYEPLLAALTPAARHAVTAANYARLVLDARPKMQAFARHVLTPAFVEGQLRAWAHGEAGAGGRFDPDSLRAIRDAAYAGAGVDVDGKGRA